VTEQEIRAYLAAVYPSAIWLDVEVPTIEVTYSFEGMNLTEDDIKTASIAVQQDL
jgi:hypothetical protein